MGFSGRDLGYLLGRNGSFGRFGMTSSFFGYFSGGFSVGFLSGIIRGQITGLAETVHLMDLYGLFGLCGDAENGRFGLLTWMV